MAGLWASDLAGYILLSMQQYPEPERGKILKLYFILWQGRRASVITEAVLYSAGAFVFSHALGSMMFANHPAGVMIVSLVATVITAIISLLWAYRMQMKRRKEITGLVRQDSSMKSLLMDLTTIDPDVAPEINKILLTVREAT